MYKVFASRCRRRKDIVVIIVLLEVVLEGNIFLRDQSTDVYVHTVGIKENYFSQIVSFSLKNSVCFQHRPLKNIQKT